MDVPSVISKRPHLTADFLVFCLFQSFHPSLVCLTLQFKFTGHFLNTTHEEDTPRFLYGQSICSVDPCCRVYVIPLSAPFPTLLGDSVGFTLSVFSQLLSLQENYILLQIENPQFAGKKIYLWSLTFWEGNFY